MFKWIFLILITPSLLFAKQPALHVGTINFYPPFVTRLESSGGFSGFDIDIMSEICYRLKKRCVFHAYRLDDILTLIEKNEIDVAIGGILITDTREKLINFSEPYATSELVFLVAEHQKPTFNNDTTGMLTWLSEKWLKTLEIDPYRIKHYDDIYNMVDDLVNGVISKALMDSQVAKYWVDSSDFDVVIDGDQHIVGHGYGIAISPQHKNLKKQIDDILNQMEIDGTYIKIYNNYFPL